MCLNPLSVELLLQACIEEAASKGLLGLMSTWIQRDFGMMGIPSAGHSPAFALLRIGVLLSLSWRRQLLAAWV